MKTLNTLVAISVFVLSVHGEELFVPRLPIDHKVYIDQALAHLLKERPDLKPENLELMSLDYQFQPMPETTVNCGPKGCIMVPAAPFVENLAVSFRILDSKHMVSRVGVNYIEYDGINVQFPTPRLPEWFLGKCTISSLAREGPSTTGPNPQGAAEPTAKRGGCALT